MVAGSRPLTSRQAEVYRAVGAYMRANGMPPTLTEMCGALGIARPQGVRVHYEALEKKGWARIKKGEARGISLLTPDGSCPYCGAGGSVDGGECGQGRGEV